MKKIILSLLFSITALVAIEFTMTKEGLFTDTNIQSNIPDETINTHLDISNLEIVNISSNSAKITWQGNPDTQTWVYVHEPYNTTGTKHSATNNHYTYVSLGADITFTVYVQGIGSNVILKQDFKTKQNTPTSEVTPTPTSEVTPTPTSEVTPTPIGNFDQTDQYLEPVNLPKCNANDPEVQFIRTNDDWGYINNSNKRIFCVSPGNYTALKNILITRSGTSTKKRYLVLNNGNDIHPGKLKKSQLANYALEFQKANYWVVDRAAAFDTHGVQSFVLNRDASHNIFNRIFTNNVYQAFWIRHNANYNTIQNSRFDTMTMQGREDDLSNINIVDWTNPFVVLGTKILNNEFLNGKAFRLNRYPEQQQFANFDGTIFDHNNIEYTSELYTDCKGNFTPNGACIAGEATGAATKSGSLDPNNPIIISNNHIWGYRPSDPTFLKLSNKGVGIQAYMGSKYIHIKNNIIFDGTSGIKLADRYEKLYGTEYIEITENLIYNCGNRNYSGGQTSLQVGQAYHANVRNNTIINPIGYSAKVIYNYTGNYVGDNTIINPTEGILASPNNGTIEGLSTNITNTTVNHKNLNYSSQGTKYTKDYTFLTDRYTNNPRTITLKNAIE
jgi:hypothetical protein